MKKVFRKITAIGASILMAGMTAGVAAAANFPAPFVDNGVADVAVVYGTGQGVSSLDMVHAGNIQATLGESMPSTGVSVSGGEAFKLEKSSDKFNFNNNLNTIYTSLDNDEMDFLADGTYDDGDIDTDYDQTITLSSQTLELFADNDYNDDVPTVGFHWRNGQTILSYTIDFDDDIPYADLTETNLPLLGNEYYVLSVTNGTAINVLDTADTRIVYSGETVTVGGYEVELMFVDASSVKFKVNGETTDSIAVNTEYELNDGSYIVATDIMYQGYADGTQGAEFSVGSGKIELLDGEEAEANDVDIDGLEVTLTDGSAGDTHLSSITLTWKSDRDTFLTEDNSITMPGFEVIKLAFGGLTFPSDSETISIENGEVLTIKMGNYDLPLMWFSDGTDFADQKFGEEDYELILSASGNTYTYTQLGYSENDTIWWNGFAVNATDGDVAAAEDAATVALNLSEDDRFLVTLIDDDLSDVETGYYEVNLIDVDDTDTWTIEFTDLIGSNDLKFENDIDETDEIGDITVTHAAFNSADNASAIFEFSSLASGTIAFNKAVSEKGLVMTFPTDISDATDGTGYVITFQEEDKDDDLEDGDQFTATVKNTTNDKYHISEHNVTDYEVSDDNWLGYVPSDLASKITFDDGADENDYSIEYYGGEVTADVQVVAGGEVTSGGGALGDVLVTDAESGTVSGKNLIVVGGSCINSAAATLLGGNYCGPSFTSATSVGAGQFLIQSFGDAYSNGKIALLVAGYNVDDTVAAATYLRTQDVDTTAGNKYIGTDSNTAELVV